MVRHNGYRSKTRDIFRKDARTSGLPGLSKFMIEYEVGDYVDIIGDPSQVKRGFPHRRFQGKTGIVSGTRGRCYEVQVYIGNKQKTIIIGKEHLRKNKLFLQKQAQAESQ